MSNWRVIALGNPLMGDDGVGLAVVEALRQQPLPGAVELVDGGTAGHVLLEMMAGADQVLLIDAVDMGAAPGAVRRFTLDQVLLEETAGWSLHQAGMTDSLLLGREMGRLPPVLVLVGIQPQRIERRMGLSPPVAAGVATAVGVICAELTGAGPAAADGDRRG